MQYDSQTKEPYLRLPDPMANIIITPPRIDDAETLVRILSDESVYRWLAAIPHPYTENDAKEWLTIATKRSKAILAALEGQADSQKAEGCPVNAIREMKEDGTQVFLGSIGVFRGSFSHLEISEEMSRLKEENLQREAGDPGIVWAIGGTWAISTKK